MSIHDLTFTSWTAYTDGEGTAKTLDWSSVDAMRGRLAYPYIEALRQDLINRVTLFPGHPASSAISILSAYPPPAPSAGHDLLWTANTIRLLCQANAYYMNQDFPDLWPETYPTRFNSVLIRSTLATMVGERSGYAEGADIGYTNWHQPTWFLTRDSLVSDSILSEESLSAIEDLATGTDPFILTAQLVYDLYATAKALSYIRFGVTDTIRISLQQKAGDDDEYHDALYYYNLAPWTDVTGIPPAGAQVQWNSGGSLALSAARYRSQWQVSSGTFGYPISCPSQALVFPYQHGSEYQQPDYAGLNKGEYQLVSADPSALFSVGHDIDPVPIGLSYNQPGWTGYAMSHPFVCRYFCGTWLG